MSNKPTSNAQRVNAWRNRLRAEGAQQVTIMLPVDAMKALHRIKRDRLGMSTTEAITDALIAYKPKPAKRKKGKANEIAR